MTNSRADCTMELITTVISFKVQVALGSESNYKPDIIKTSTFELSIKAPLLGTAVSKRHIKVEVAFSDKHASLLYIGVYYEPKRFYS